VNNNRDRLAWVVLITSFVICLGLAIGTPLGIRHLLRTACMDQDGVLEPQRGTPRVQRRGRGDVSALIGPSWDVPPGTVMTTDGSAQGLLTLFAPGQEPSAVVAVQAYGDTEIVLENARSPRFSISPLPHRVVLSIRAGRVRISVAPTEDRSTVVELHTPHLTAQMGEGSYEVRVRPALSEVTTREGSARVTSDGAEVVSLDASERTVAEIGSDRLEILPAERNLLVNGSFRQMLETGWQIYHEEQQPPPGTVEVVNVAGRPAALFQRSGVGHAEVGIRQLVNYDVRDFSSLVLHLGIQVRGQSLNGCGSVGSECPVIVRIDYKDIHGNDRVWYHGFFSLAPTENDFLYPWDEQVPFHTWVTFDSGNLVEAFEEPPALISALTIYASGHSFDALVTEVELLAEE